MGIAIETVNLPGCSMDFFRFGSGERTFVILPGLSVQSVMGAAEAIAAEYRHLTEDYTVYVFDRRKELPPVYTVADMARDTAAALQALGLTDVYLFGASQGGMMGLQLALDYPALIKKMVLGSTTSHLLPEHFKILEKWVGLARQKDREGLYLAFGEALYPPQVFAEYKATLLQAAATVTEEELSRFIIMAECTRDFNVTERLPEIKCPVLAIGVFEDAVLDADATMEIAEKLDFRPDFRLYMYVGHGHAAYDTAPDYRQRILEFFAG
ncbi:MAG: alpha/beta hydrolase [Firmicutes bacterium]|nr:alpha/beta hydrolase [Bacillota bacterium]